MKRLLIVFAVAALLCLTGGLARANEVVSRADTTPSNWSAYTGSGYIARVIVLCSQATRVSFYDTSTETAPTSPFLMLETQDNDDIDWERDAGSYAYFRNGIQVTSTAEVNQIIICIRPHNGWGGEDETVADSTPSRWLAYSGSGWISSITIICSQTVTTVTMYDTNTNTATSGVEPVLADIVAEDSADTDGIKELRMAAGTYIPFRNGLQITADKSIRFFRVNVRQSNGF